MITIEPPRPPRTPWWRVSAFAASSIAIVAAAVALAQQPDRARIEALARRATERMQALQREADALAGQEKTLLGDLRKLEVARELKAEAQRRAELDAEKAAADLDAANARLAALEQQDVSERPELQARLVELYKLGGARYVRLLLSTSDLRQIGQASRMVATLAALDRSRIEAHEQTLRELKASRAGLEQRTKALATARTEADRAAAAAARAVESRNALVRDIDRRRDLNAQLAGELQSAQAKLQVSLRELASGSPAGEATLPLRPFRGDLPWPAKGPVHPRLAPKAATAGTASKGIEIGAPEGTPAVAVHDGTVVYADRFTGFGNLVIVQHGPQAFSLYGDLGEIAVRKGDRVDRGQPVGTVGESVTGQAGLYFELRIDGQPVDPLQWLKRR